MNRLFDSKAVDAVLNKFKYLFGNFNLTIRFNA